MNAKCTGCKNEVIEVVCTHLGTFLCARCILELNAEKKVMFDDPTLKWAKQRTFIKPSFESLPSFAQGYIMAAFWTTDETPGQGEYSTGGRPEVLYSKLSDEALKAMLADCEQFTKEHGELLEASGIEDGRAGHCFWLSRCGHGSGFFDEGTISSSCQDHLQEAARKAGNRDLYFGDDGQLYIS